VNLVLGRGAPGLLKRKLTGVPVLKDLGAPVAPLADAYALGELLGGNEVFERSGGNAELSADICLFKPGGDGFLLHGMT
jgi:hypothetical protein